MRPDVREQMLRRHHVESIAYSSMVVCLAYPEHAAILMQGMCLYLTDDERSSVDQKIALLSADDGAAQ